MDFLGSLAKRSQQSNKSGAQVKSPSRTVTPNNHVAFGEFSGITVIRPRKSCVSIRILMDSQYVSFLLHHSQQ